MINESKTQEIVLNARDRGFNISEDMVNDLLIFHCRGDYFLVEERLEKIFKEYGESLKES